MSLLFKDRHIPMIREGEKTATRRIWDENYGRPTVGSVQMAVTEMFTPEEECDCFIRITDVYDEPLNEMEAEDFDKEGGYTRDEFVEIWEDLYGEWDPELVVDVVEFEYVGRHRHTGDEHPSQKCGVCGAALGHEEGYVTLASGRILVYCERGRCQSKVDELKDDVGQQSDRTLASFEGG